MSNEESRLQFEAAEEDNKSNSSFEKLRAKLKNFTVKDKQGELIGVVEDLILEPNRQINFVISQEYGEQSRSVLFNSKLVQKVDRLNQSVILDINKADYPQHIAIETLGMETPENLDKSVTPAYEAVDEEITNIDLYSSIPPTENADATENTDIDIASMFDMTADDQEDTMLGSGVEFSATPMASGNIDVNPIFDTTSINTQQDIDLDQEVEFSTMSTTSDDIDITSMFDIAADDIPEEITLDSDVDLLLTPDDAVTDIESQIDTTAIASENLVEEELIRLLGERVTVERSKRKVGEVIVRKEIETRMIQVPVRREKLIIEQVGSENKQLAEIDLGLAEISGIEAHETQFTGAALSGLGSLDNALTVRGEFNSPKIASLLLNAIALERRQGCQKIRVEIVVDDVERQKTYQEWIDRASGNKNAANL